MCIVGVDLGECFAAGIRLRFLDLAPILYNVPASYPFTPSLSVFDVLTWNDPLVVTTYIGGHSDPLPPQDLSA